MSAGKPVGSDVVKGRARGRNYREGSRVKRYVLFDHDGVLVDTEFRAKLVYSTLRTSMTNHRVALPGIAPLPWAPYP